MKNNSYYPDDAPRTVPYPPEYQRILLDTRKKCENMKKYSLKPLRRERDKGIPWTDSFCMDCY